MPIIKSAIKRARQTQKRHSHNLTVAHAVKRDVRVLTDAIAAGEAKTIDDAWKAAQSEIDRAVKKGVLHKNAAARQKSQLNRLLVAAQAEKPAKAPAKAKTAVKKVTAKKPATKGVQTHPIQ